MLSSSVWHRELGKFMQHVLTVKTNDYSDGTQFSFGFICDQCGSEWRSLSVPYDCGGFAEVSNDDTKLLLWRESHRIAFERACVEAIFHFNHCQICGRWVCDECFYLSGTSTTDICKSCLPSYRPDKSIEHNNECNKEDG
jgi:hypothetical protein